RWQGVDAAARSLGRETAEPPRIEDMAPGTTFTARCYTDRAETDTLWMVCRYVGIVSWYGGVLRDLNKVDPSTIRDVQPPKDAA
ncbi:hypothetical protein, partial [Curtobacterium luteum]|uniref:hypothetical protein n=1 Tax=Curtobacterium luteum TaxID=33881 RepID=UPI000AA620BF